jgi:hypothetical protein
MHQARQNGCKAPQGADDQRRRHQGEQKPPPRSWRKDAPREKHRRRSPEIDARQEWLAELEQRPAGGTREGQLGHEARHDQIEQGKGMERPVEAGGGGLQRSGALRDDRGGGNPLHSGQTKGEDGRTCKHLRDALQTGR